MLKLIFTSFLNTLNGWVQLSLPFIVLYFYCPQFILSFNGAIFCSFLIGLKLAFIVYQQGKNMIKGLQFTPTGKFKKYFDKQIKEVGLNPENISLRYAYCDTNIALTAFNTIIIDQMIWSGFDEDPVFIEAQQVVKKHLQPTFSIQSKKLHKEIKAALTPHAQKFIFKHELGHVVDKYSWKKVILNAFIGFTATFVSFSIIQNFITVYDNLLVLFLAIIVAAFIDLSSSYLSNGLFKVSEEQNADIFAVKYSSKKEIIAAADFFEQYEKHAKEYRKSIGSMADYSTRFLMGYVPSEERVQSLKKAAEAK